MGNPIIRKIVTYLYIWLILFFVLCVISIVKNREILGNMMRNKITGAIVILIFGGAIFTALVSIITGGRR